MSVHFLVNQFNEFVDANSVGFVVVWKSLHALQPGEQTWVLITMDWNVGFQRSNGSNEVEISNGQAVSTEIVPVLQELLTHSIRFTNAIVLPFWDVTFVVVEKRILWGRLFSSHFQNIGEKTHIDALQTWVQDSRVEVQTLINDGMKIEILWVQRIVLGMTADQVAVDSVTVPDVFAIFDLQDWNGVLWVLFQELLLQMFLGQKIDGAELPIQAQSLEAQQNSTNWWADFGSVQDVFHFGFRLYFSRKNK